MPDMAIEEQPCRPCRGTGKVWKAIDPTPDSEPYCEEVECFYCHGNKIVEVEVELVAGV